MFIQSTLIPRKTLPEVVKKGFFSYLFVFKKVFFMLVVFKKIFLILVVFHWISKQVKKVIFWLSDILVTKRYINWSLWNQVLLNLTFIFPRKSFINWFDVLRICESVAEMSSQRSVTYYLNRNCNMTHLQFDIFWGFPI